MLFTIMSSWVVTSGWQVRGRKIKWTMTAADGWIGGNYYQIDSAMQKTSNKIIKTLLGIIRRNARSLDVYLLHLNDGVQMSQSLERFTTRTLTKVKVNLVEDPVLEYIDIEGYRNDIWSAFARLAEADNPTGSHTRILKRHRLITGGLPAYQAIFKTSRPDGGIVYEVEHIVRLDSKRSHIFNLEVDSVKYRLRYTEFTRMLESLRYE